MLEINSIYGISIITLDVIVINSILGIYIANLEACIYNCLEIFFI